MPYVTTSNPTVVVIVTCPKCKEQYPASGSGYHYCPHPEGKTA